MKVIEQVAMAMCEEDGLDWNCVDDGGLWSSRGEYIPLAKAAIQALIDAEWLGDKEDMLSGVKIIQAKQLLTQILEEK